MQRVNILLKQKDYVSISEKTFSSNSYASASELQGHENTQSLEG